MMSIDRSNKPSPTEASTKRSDAIWIFGYGSLIWKPGFAFLEQRIGTIRGWSRRFYQGSTDHRGVPGSPGRVVTLIQDAEAACWGVAYQVSADSLESVFAYLDYREKGGFRRYKVAFHEANAPHPACQVHVYVAEPDNPNYLGPAALSAMAQQIHQSQGPSGPNTEYLLRLAEGLRALGITDDHVFALERQVRLLES